MLLADTSSRVANFAPQQRDDPSLRALQPQGDLFPPFCILPSVDLFATEYFKFSRPFLTGEETAWIEFIKSRDKDPTEFAKLGSPLWSVHLAEKEIVDGNELAEYASCKLAGRLIPQKDIKTIDLISALTSRINLTILPSSSLAVELVASHMAQLDLVSQDRSLLYVSYPSDPTLAAGASLLLRDRGVACLENLASTLLQGVTDAGNSGEVAFEIAAVAAADSLLLVLEDDLKRLYKSFSMVDFMKILLPQSADPWIDEYFEKCKGFFNHFMTLKSDCDENACRMAVYRGAAISCRSYQAGIDEVIPYINASGNLSYIFVQIKNYWESIGQQESNKIFRDMKKASLDSLRPITEKKSKASDKILSDRSTYILFNMRRGRDSVSQSVRISKNCLCVQGPPSLIFKSLWGRNDAENQQALELLDSIISSKNHVVELAPKYLPPRFLNLAKTSNHFRTDLSINQLEIIYESVSRTRSLSASGAGSSQQEASSSLPPAASPPSPPAGPPPKRGKSEAKL
jgi:hypothetical protein